MLLILISNFALQIYISLLSLKRPPTCSPCDLDFNPKGILMECNASAWLSWFCRIFISWTQWSSYFVNREIEQKSQWVFPSPIFWLICLMMKLELESFVWKLPKILLFSGEKKLVVPIENSLMSVVVWSVTLISLTIF